LLLTQKVHDEHRQKHTFALAFPTYTTHPVPCNDQPGYG